MSARPNVRDSGDRRQVRQGRRAERDQQAQDREDLRAVMATAGGRRVMWRLLKQGRIAGDLTPGEASQWHPSALIHYHAGAFDIGKALDYELRCAALDLYRRMEDENAAYPGLPPEASKETDDDGPS